MAQVVSCCAFEMSKICRQLFVDNIQICLTNWADMSFHLLLKSSTMIHEALSWEEMAQVGSKIASRIGVFKFNCFLGMPDDVRGPQVLLHDRRHAGVRALRRHQPMNTNATSLAHPNSGARAQCHKSK